MNVPHWPFGVSVEANIGPSAPSRLKVGVPGNAGICDTHGHKEAPMIKKYVVRLTDEERGVCQEIIKKLKGTSEKVMVDPIV